MTKVRDVMNRRVLTIDPHAKLEDVAWGLTMKGVSGAPVKDERGRVIGVLSKSDLADPDKRHGDHPAETAEDAMTPVLFAAKEGDPLRFAVERMVRTGAHRLVVIDDLGALVCIITPMDILRALLEGRAQVGDFEA
jgi:predicted transcriptional regulator